MRYPAAEKAEIIRLVEQSHLSARQTLDRIGVSRFTFYRWYDLNQTGGPEALEDMPSSPNSAFALMYTIGAMSPRKLRDLTKRRSCEWRFFLNRNC
jgi:transposase-like protein